MIFFFVILSIFSLTFAHDHSIKKIYNSNQDLYPIQESFNKEYLKVSYEHQIFFEEFGNPNGIPVIILHGGPGWGCDKTLTCFFDTSYYRIIMFDQRGCGRSLPFGQMKDNTPQDSVNDIEILRKHLKINKWIIFGGSYGSLLAILYGENHSERVYAFVLRGIFLGRMEEYENLFYGMSKFFPEAYKSLADLVEEKNNNIIKSIYEIIMQEDRKITQPIADAFMYYDLLCANLIPDFEQIKNNLEKNFTLSVTRTFLHYAINDFFLKENQLLNDIDKIQNIPAFIVHGRYDLICPVVNAFDLYHRWKNSQLWLVEDAGHSAFQKSISQSLKNIMEELKTHKLSASL